MIESSADSVASPVPRPPRTRALRALAVALLVSGCSVVGIRSGTAEPPFMLVTRVGDLEIRRYPARIAVETVVRADEIAARSDGFRRLAGYIFGENRSQAAGGTAASEKIPMTAPVAQQRVAGDRWKIQFFAPATYRLAAMPVPENPEVGVVAVPEQTYAVRRFSGSRSADAIAAQTLLLLGALRGSGWRPTGVPVAWFYDPPWTLPPFRRNEVAVTVEPREK